MVGGEDKTLRSIGPFGRGRGLRSWGLADGRPPLEGIALQRFIFFFAGSNMALGEAFGFVSNLFWDVCLDFAAIIKIDSKKGKG